MQGYLQGTGQMIAHRRASHEPLTLAVDLEDGNMIVIVIKETGEVGLMAFDTSEEASIDELHIVARYDKQGDYEVEGLGIMHTEVEAMIHAVADLGGGFKVYPEGIAEDDEDWDEDDDDME